MRRTVLVILAIVVVAAIAGAAYLVFAPNSTSSQSVGKVITDQNAINKQVVAFIRNPYLDDYGIARIPGYVQNKGKATLKSVDLDIQLYDEKGNKKELVKYTVLDIAPQGRKSFDANGGTVPMPREAKGKITKIEVVEQ